MGSVLLDVTMSLDGFITGPNGGVDLPLGDGEPKFPEQDSDPQAHGPP